MESPELVMSIVSRSSGELLSDLLSDYREIIGNKIFGFKPVDVARLTISSTRDLIHLFLF